MAKKQEASGGVVLITESLVNPNPEYTISAPEVNARNGLLDLGSEITVTPEYAAFLTGTGPFVLGGKTIATKLTGRLARLKEQVQDV